MAITMEPKGFDDTWSFLHKLISGFLDGGLGQLAASDILLVSQDLELSLCSGRTSDFSRAIFIGRSSTNTFSRGIKVAGSPQNFLRNLLYLSSVLS